MSDSDYDCDAPSSNSDGSSIEEEQAELTLDDDDHEICAAAQTSKKTRYHSPCKQSNPTDITSDFSAISFKGHNAMLGDMEPSDEEDEESADDSEAPARAAGKGHNAMSGDMEPSDEEDEESDDDSEAPAPARAAGKGRNAMSGDMEPSDEEDEESDDDSEAPAPARAAGNLKIGDESDSDASSSVSNFQFGTRKHVTLSNLDDGFQSEGKHWICLRPFTGTFSTLPNEDKKEMKEIFDKYELTGADVGDFLAQQVLRRRNFETTFLKSEDDTDFQVCRFTRSDGKVYSRKYDPSFAQGLQRWDDLGRKTSAETMEQLFKDAQALIKKWNETGEGDPNVRDLKLGQDLHLTSRSRAWSPSRIRGPHLEAFRDGMDNDVEDVFGGRLVVRLYDSISGEMMGVQSHFNVSKPGQSPFHGFTILSGAGVLADNLMGDYSSENHANWGLLLRSLRRFGVREDICNVGNSDSPDLGHINNRKFIFYHEHLRADGFEDFKNVRTINNRVYQD